LNIKFGLLKAEVVSPLLLPSLVKGQLEMRIDGSTGVEASSEELAWLVNLGDSPRLF
jgi:hypothetical protein